MSLPGAWPDRPWMPAATHLRPGTSSWSPGCPRWPARCATSPASPPSWPARHRPDRAQAGHRHRHPGGRFTFHVLAAMDERWPTSSPRAPTKAWPPPGPAAGRRPQTQADGPAGRGGPRHVRRDRRRREAQLYRAEIAGTFAVSGKTIYRHLDDNGAQRQPDEHHGRGPSPARGHWRAPPHHASGGRPAGRRPARSASVPASPLPRWPARPADTPPAGPKRSRNADLTIVWLHQDSPSGRPASTGTARAASPTSNAAPSNARTPASARARWCSGSISSGKHASGPARRPSAPGRPATAW